MLKQPFVFHSYYFPDLWISFKLHSHFPAAFCLSHLHSCTTLHNTNIDYINLQLHYRKPYNYHVYLIHLFLQFIIYCFIFLNTVRFIHTTTSVLISGVYIRLTMPDCSMGKCQVIRNNETMSPTEKLVVVNNENHKRSCVRKHLLYYYNYSWCLYHYITHGIMWLILVIWKHIKISTILR